MTDWRSGLSWVPIVVFSVLLLASFVVGLAGGYKRVLYWTGGNLALWLIAFIITAAGGDSIASSLAKLIKEKVSASEIQEMSNKELTDAVRMYLGLGIYILAAIVGNLLILLPMYFGGYVKWCKIGKYDPRSKKYDKYVAKVALKNKNKAERLKKAKTKIKMSNKGYFWLSRGIAMPLSVVLGLPMVATATQLAFGGTVQTSSMLTASGKNKNLKGLYEFTSWITDNIGKHYVDGLADNSSAIISGINLGINDDANLEDLFNKIKDCMDSVDDVGDSLDEAKLESIEATFTNYAVYANDHRSKFEPWLKDLSYSKKTLDIVRSLINSFIEPEEEPAVTEENFSNIQVFIDGVLNGCWVNTVEGTDPITLGNYEFDWYTNPETAAVFKRLALDPDVYDVIAKTLRSAVFDPTWTKEKEEESLDAAKSIVALFFMHDTNENSVPTGLDIIIGPDQIITDNRSSFEKILPEQTKIEDELIDCIINQLHLEPPYSTAVKENKDQIIEALKQKGVYMESNFENVMDEIAKNSTNEEAGGVDREEWGSEENPYVMPVDSLYTFDYEQLTEHFDEYFQITLNITQLDPFQFTLDVNFLQSLPCKKTEVFSGNAPIWWSFVPHFYPIYNQPDYDINFKAEPKQGEWEGWEEYVATYLYTDWQKSGKTNSSLSTGVPEDLPDAKQLAILSSNNESSDEKNIFKLIFTYKNKVTGEETTFTKYMKLTTIFDYYYNGPN